MPSIEAIRSRAYPALRKRFRACLLAGAAGDALGAAVEFSSKQAILAKFGPAGIRDYAPAYGRLGAITDDTQMTLFTAEGLMRAWVRWSYRGISSTPNVVSAAYLRWYTTQGTAHPLHENRPDGWLIGIKELHASRAPGRTCLAALRDMRSFGDLARNQSKGCGGVMRVAPVGMFEAAAMQPGARGGSGNTAFDLGCQTAAITHGHPTGILASGLFADIISQLLQGASLPDAIEHGRAILRKHPDHEETENIVRRACELAAQSPDATTIPEDLGEGWIAEEALAISLYAALLAPDLESGVILAVNHSGDSDSTGAIAGNLLGAMYGLDAIPPRWLTDLELREVIEEVADDLASMWFWKIDEYEDPDGSVIASRYPGW
ncbi:MAG: ADP-ribosylglycohydrolase family protein [Xanthomonadaceae bacterium]|nr:ADP-ribosylglycohydrolase family protein [Xanthomonadaceae bacterium]